MPVLVRFTSEQNLHINEALDKAKVVYSNRGGLELTADNYGTILQTLKTTHAKTLAIKTRTVAHMERMYALQNVIKRLEEYNNYFPKQVVEQDNGDVVNEVSETDVFEDKEAA